MRSARGGTVPGGALIGSFRAGMKEVDVQPTREGWKPSPQTYEPDGGRTEHEALSWGRSTNPPPNTKSYKCRGRRCKRKTSSPAVFSPGTLYSFHRHLSLTGFSAPAKNDAVQTVSW